MIRFTAKGVLDWVLVVIFGLLGVMNLLWIHVVPGVFYLIISILYVPLVVGLLEVLMGFKVPYGVRIAGAVVLLWATLAVGDLAELFGL